MLLTASPYRHLVYYTTVMANLKILKFVHNTVNTPWYTVWWNMSCSSFLGNKKKHYCNRTLVEKRNTWNCWQRSTPHGKEILEAWRSYKVINGENTEDRSAGLRSVGKEFWRIVSRTLLRGDIQNKDCRVYSYVYVKKHCTVFLIQKNNVVQEYE